MDTATTRMQTGYELRARVEQLYYDYAAVLDDKEFDRWPDFFTEDCFYRVTSRENIELGLPLGIILAESRGMLQDRVVALKETSMYVPRRVRHFVTNIRIFDPEPNGIRVRANFSVHQTLPDQETAMFLSGECWDRLVEEGGKLLFAEKICIHDATVVPISLVYPL
jgi:3-phenylpropionate/cinnamic acid dioxygenase small subunit